MDKAAYVLPKPHNSHDSCAHTVGVVAPLRQHRCRLLNQAIWTSPSFYSLKDGQEAQDRLKLQKFLF